MQIGSKLVCYIGHDKKFQIPISMENPNEKLTKEGCEGLPLHMGITEKHKLKHNFNKESIIRLR